MFLQKIIGLRFLQEIFVLGDNFHSRRFSEFIGENWVRKFHCKILKSTFSKLCTFSVLSQNFIFVRRIFYVRLCVWFICATLSYAISNAIRIY